jgi:hypothetical protein
MRAVAIAYLAYAHVCLIFCVHAPHTMPHEPVCHARPAQCMPYLLCPLTTHCTGEVPSQALPPRCCPAGTGGRRRGPPLPPSRRCMSCTGSHCWPRWQRRQCPRDRTHRRWHPPRGRSRSPHDHTCLLEQKSGGGHTGEHSRRGGGVAMDKQAVHAMYKATLHEATKKV